MRSLKAIQREVTETWGITHTLSAVVACLIPLLPRLLGSSAKIIKGLKRGVLTSVIYMSPAGEAFGIDPNEVGGKTLCPSSTLACRLSCLGTSAGRMIQRGVKNARIWKTALFFGNRGLFSELLTSEVNSLQASAERQGLTPAVRVDGSSDTGFGALMAVFHPNVIFYDYTKVLARALKFCRGGFTPNYHVTFSYSGKNWADCLQVLNAGGNVAVAFSTHPNADLPSDFQGFEVIDGDITDARFMDPRGDDGRGVVVGLRFKTIFKRAEAIRKAGDFLADMGNPDRFLPAGTLLELTEMLDGNEENILAALLGGFRLIGNFKGREASLLPAGDTLRIDRELREDRAARFAEFGV